MDQTLTKPPLDSAIPPLGPRQYGSVNWLGLWTLCLRETRRFWKVGAQTVAGPVVTTLLYMLVFVVALQGARPPLHGRGDAGAAPVAKARSHAPARPPRLGPAAVVVVLTRSARAGGVGVGAVLDAVPDP